MVIFGLKKILGLMIVFCLMIVLCVRKIVVGLIRVMLFFMVLVWVCV